MRTLTVADLPHLLAQVADHRYRDPYSLPTLAGVRLEADTTHLYAVATDRFTLAVARTPLGTDSHDSAGFAAFLTATDLTTLTALAKATRTRTATLTEQPDTLTVRLDQHRLDLPAHHQERDTFPQWRPLLRPALRGEPALAEEIGLAPWLLARWTAHLPARDRYTPLLVWGTGPGEPLVLARGEDFLGLQMPVTLEDRDNSRARVREQWEPVLALAPATEPGREQVAA